MDNNLANKLLKKKKEIDDAKIELAKLEGSQKSKLEQLKKDFNCDSIEDGEIRLKELEKEIEKMDKEIKEEYEKLNEFLQAVEMA